MSRPHNEGSARSITTTSIYFIGATFEHDEFLTPRLYPGGWHKAQVKKKQTNMKA
jgi:hypothetical protein